MDFIEITNRLAHKSNVEIGPALARYQGTTTEPTVDGFLRYLREQGVIDTHLFTELHTAGNVDTSVDASALAQQATRASYSPDTVATRIDAGARSAESNGHGEAPPQNQTEVYEMLGALGKGAMGEVHLARDMLLRRKVALKCILPEMQQHEALYSRFIGEMQITAQLDHPSIVPVYGVESMPNGGLGYAMKLVQGREFKDLLNETRLAIAEGKPLDANHSLEGRLEAFLKVCDALSYAHDRGIVHRDLKPANIMIGSFNEVYVMDWGIARLMGRIKPGEDKGVEMYDASGADLRGTTRTHLGSTLGTPVYMSPEQAAGLNDDLDGRSDLYSLGLILQEIVTLTGAVGGTTLEEVLTNAKGARRLPPTPPAPGIDVPRELRAIIDKATQLKPSDRYASVSAFADDIRRYLRNEAIGVLPDTQIQAMGRWVSKHRLATIAMLLVALVLGAGATIGVLLYNRSVVAQQHRRELRLAELQASSAMRAEGLDSYLQRDETRLSRLAGALDLALDQSADTAEKHADVALHFADDFKAGSTAVSGLVQSPVYGALVSFDWPVVSLPRGTTKEQAAAELGTVNSLRVLARSIMLESADPNYHALSEAERARALSETGASISRISLTMQSGLHVEYPGRASLAQDYDGRNEPSYKAASAAQGVVWGEPTQGKDGSMFIPCSTALRDSEGKLRGVLTFDVDTKRAIDAALEAGGASSYVETSFLVDISGKVLAQKNQAGGAADDALGLDEVKAAIGRGERGYMQTKRNGHDVLVTYNPLSTLGLYLVTVANLDRMKTMETPEGSHGASVAPAAPVTATPKAMPRPTAVPTVPPQVTATASASASAEPSASASASESASAPPPAASSAPAAPALTGRLSDIPKPSAAPTASAPPPPPPNPFDPWKAYDKK